MNRDITQDLTKEDDNMEAINKPKESMMIARGMTKAFVDLLATQKCSEEYWNECKTAKKSISSSAMDKMKKMCNGEKDV